MHTHPLQKAIRVCVCFKGSCWTPGFRTESVFCAVDDKGIHRGREVRRRENEEREECVKQFDTGSTAADLLGCIKVSHTATHKSQTVF